MKIEDLQLLTRIVEGVVMASEKPISKAAIKELFDDLERPSNELIEQALERLATDCSERAYELKQVASGYRFQVRQDLSKWVNKLWKERAPRYSRALLETLSLIAYRQPITRGEIESIRGVAVSSQIVRTLLEREWIKAVGHRDVPGRPAIYATTREFLDYFNLKSLDQLPPLAEIRDLNTISRELNIELPLEADADVVANDEQMNSDKDSAVDQLEPLDTEQVSEFVGEVDSNERLPDDQLKDKQRAEQNAEQTDNQQALNELEMLGHNEPISVDSNIAELSTTAAKDEATAFDQWVELGLNAKESVIES